ncbi:hypothetical protein HF086_016422 [Spodoptera exigua]|uniref:UBZ3-type domain-containing protein n=1 Tax=Spodoptera exigua TaxID=7107 RepID=A0A922MQY3_SPOEX|nr:hypothetical protein HF086_016422 [Spodoptera exigua]
MQKFLQTTQKQQENESTQKENIEIINKTNNPVVESSLEKQESFFAKMLNQNKCNSNISRVQQTEAVVQKIRPTTPLCDVVACGEDSNDSNYSRSTINEEINNSVALFEEDPTEVARVRSMRELLTSSRTINEDDSDTVLEPEQQSNALLQKSTTPRNESHIDTYKCPDCEKAVPITEITEHSDFHLALKLREEERQNVRKEIKEKRYTKYNQNVETQKQLEQTSKSESVPAVSSIANFLVKIDDNIPTEVCSTCGKKVPIDKFGEHLDFHEAQKLSRELNKKTSPPFTSNNVKRKRKSNSPVKKTKMPCRSIDSFFR